MWRTLMIVCLVATGLAAGCARAPEPGGEATPEAVCGRGGANDTVAGSDHDAAHAATRGRSCPDGGRSGHCNGDATRTGRSSIDSDSDAKANGTG